MIAKTDAEKKRCFDWLWERKAAALTDLFYYKEYKGEIIAVAGVLHSVGDKSSYLQIEPMISDSPRASYDLYNEIIEYAVKIKARFILAGSSNQKVHKNLEKLGWRKWNTDVTHYIKELL